MRRFLILVAWLLAGLAPAKAEPENPMVLALWEFDGWGEPTPERPLGLRFVLLANGSVIYTPDDPAIDALIPSQYFQAQLTSEESEALGRTLMPTLAAASATSPQIDRQRGWSVFYYRDAATGEQRRVAIAGWPCLAKGRVFSVSEPVPGLQAVRNTRDRMALSRGMRDACDRLAGFHHKTTLPWSSDMVPASMPEP